MGDQIREIDVLIRARYSLIYVVSWEEGRVIEALQQIASDQEKKVFVWSETMGMRPASARITRGDPDESTAKPLAALDYIRTSKEPAVYVLRDFHVFLSSHYAYASAVIRKLRDLSQALHTAYTSVILLSPFLQLPPELEKDVTVIDYDLPSLPELEQLLGSAIASVKGNPEVNVELDAEERERVLKAALGLTLAEAENVFAKCLVERKSLDADLIVAEKEQLIRKSGLLEYYTPREKIDDIGGMDLLKQWLRGRALAFTDKAQAFGLPAPKGILLLGVQGCGKSLTAKAVASLWRLPLLRMDVGRIFSGLVGSSEENMRRALKMAECVSPCVLWLDEIEKGLAGVQSSAMSDAGVTARVFATLSTWMQEKTKPVFMVATANDISQLPPELLRKGRFDDIFFVDLPAAAEREEIFRIHLARRGRKPEGFDLAALAEASLGSSGAEIEQAVISALYSAFAQGRDLAQEDLEQALKETVPLSVTMQEEIDYVRRWARRRARPASRLALADIPFEEADHTLREAATTWAPGKEYDFWKL